MIAAIYARKSTEHAPLEKAFQESSTLGDLTAHQPPPVGDHRTYPALHDAAVDRPGLAESAHAVKLSPERGPLTFPGPERVED